MNKHRRFFRQFCIVPGLMVLALIITATPKLNAGISIENSQGDGFLQRLEAASLDVTLKSRLAEKAGRASKMAHEHLLKTKGSVSQAVVLYDYARSEALRATERSSELELAVSRTSERIKELDKALTHGRTQQVQQAKTGASAEDLDTLKKITLGLNKSLERLRAAHRQLIRDTRTHQAKSSRSIKASSRMAQMLWTARAAQQSAQIHYISKAVEEKEFNQRLRTANLQLGNLKSTAQALAMEEDLIVRPAQKDVHLSAVQIPLDPILLSDEFDFRVVGDLNSEASQNLYASEYDAVFESLPIQGKITGKFGQQAGRGENRGILIEVPKSSEVYVPKSGRIVFSDQLDGYGMLLIVDHGDNYHSLLAGFDEVSVSDGDFVHTRQSLGKIIVENDRSGQLYMEIRYRGMPVNPMPLFAGHGEKGRG